MLKAIQKAIIKKLIYEDSTSGFGKRLTKSIFIRGHFQQETSIPM